MDSTTRTGGRTSRDFTVRGVRAQNARFERMRARQRARQLSWRSGWIVGTHSHVPSCANTSTGISAFMAATHLEARAARVHVRVKVFEELLAAFRQQCRRTLRHLCRGSSTRSPSFSPARVWHWPFFVFVFRRIVWEESGSAPYSQIWGISRVCHQRLAGAAALLSVLTSHVCGWG